MLRRYVGDKTEYNTILLLSDPCQAKSFIQTVGSYSNTQSLTVKFVFCVVLATFICCIRQS